MLVSFIMPVYNTGVFLDTSVESVLKQTNPNFELILVDDGSTDGSSEKCDHYAGLDSRVRVIHQKNGGICNARNNGLKQAKYDYVVFVDHDDEYEIDFLEKILINNYKKYDVIKCGAKYLDVCDSQITREWTEETSEINGLNSSSLLKKYFKLPNSFFNIWNSVFRKSFLIGNNIFFDETMKFGQEDYDYMLKVLNSDCSFGAIKDVLYTHYKRVGLSTSSLFNYGRIDSINTLRDKEYSVFNNAVYAIESKALASIFTYIAQAVATGALKETNEVLKKVSASFGKCKGYFWGCVFSRISAKRKAVYLLYKLGFKKFLLRRYLKKNYIGA